MARFSDTKQAVAVAYRKLTGRSPSIKEMELLVSMQKNEYQKFKKSPKKTVGWLSAGQTRVSQKTDAALIAANAVVASTILNSDATLTKR